MLQQIIGGHLKRIIYINVKIENLEAKIIHKI